MPITSQTGECLQFSRLAPACSHHCFSPAVPPVLWTCHSASRDVGNHQVYKSVSFSHGKITLLLFNTTNAILAPSEENFQVWPQKLVQPREKIVGVYRQCAGGCSSIHAPSMCDGVVTTTPAIVTVVCGRSTTLLDRGFCSRLLEFLIVSRRTNARGETAAVSW